jgi:hypothetical protein
VPATSPVAGKEEEGELPEPDDESGPLDEPLRDELMQAASDEPPRVDEEEPGPDGLPDGLNDGA